MLLMANSENGVIFAHGIVTHQYDAQIRVRCSSLMKGCIFGECIIFAVAQALGEGCKG